MIISEKLKNLRKSKGISVYRLSELSGVSQTHIRDIERGDRNPSVDTLTRLTAPMGISLCELFNESEEIAFLNKSEKELIECFRLLSKEKADALVTFLKTII